jgi:indolepyruvate ferredoxin oxidoreductase, beta subunit
VLVDASALAREAGSARATNMVMVGAASHRLPIAPEVIEHFIRESFRVEGRQGRGRRT